MRILAYTSPARGHLFPIVPTLDRLTEQGHAVCLRTLASEMGPMQARGFTARPIARAIEKIEHSDYQGRTPASALARTIDTFGARAKEEIADLRNAIAEERPDALLIDCMTWGATAAAEAWGGPWAQWFPYPMPLPSREVPPFGPGLRPATGPLGRIRDAALRPLIESSYSRAVLPRVNAVRREVDLSPFRKTAELFTTPPLLLYMTAEPFEYPRSNWPANVRMVGPGSWDPPAEQPPWLDDLSEPLVLVSTSSEFQDDGRLVRIALDALAGEEVSVVATLPTAELDGDIPANARVERFVPHGAILERAACAITHGGAGATQKALAAGVPVCVVPFGRDQFEIARRVETAGAGVYLRPRRLRPRRLRAAVRRAMTMRQGARRVAAGYAAAGGAAAAAEAFEQLAYRWPARAEAETPPATSS